MHVDVIKLLQVRLKKTLYSRVEDQTMVWAYLCGFSDGAAKKKMEDHFVNVVFSPSINMQPPEASTPKPGNVEKEKKKAASFPKKAPARKKASPKKESTKLQKAREEAAKRVRANVKSRLRTLK